MLESLILQFDSLQFDSLHLSSDRHNFMRFDQFDNLMDRFDQDDLSCGYEIKSSSE